MYNFGTTISTSGPDLFGHVDGYVPVVREEYVQIPKYAYAERMRTRCGDRGSGMELEVAWRDQL